MGANINSQLPFSEIVKVRYSDLDAQGHLYFAKYLVFGDEVLGAYMEQLGLNIMDPLSAPCLIFTVNIHCDYHNEIAGNSEIAVYTGYGRLGKSSADAVFELYNNYDLRQDAEQMFNFYDKNSDGFIDSNELKFQKCLRAN